jgi:hypothetical protein
MERHQLVGHPRPSGELHGLFREPERLLAQTDRPTFPGPGIKMTRRDREEDQPDRRTCDEPWPDPDTSGRRIETELPGSDHAEPLAEVPGRDRADHRRELVAVSSRQQAQTAEKREQEPTEQERRPSIQSIRPFALPRLALLRPGCLSLPFPLGLIDPRRDVLPCQVE